MALALSVAQPLLADLKPPIPAAKIQESLWYYFFDVDKTVSYLRKERQKGELRLFSVVFRFCGRILGLSKVVWSRTWEWNRVTWFRIGQGNPREG